MDAVGASVAEQSKKETKMPKVLKMEQTK